MTEAERYNAEFLTDDGDTLGNRLADAAWIRCMGRVPGQPEVEVVAAGFQDRSWWGVIFWSDGTMQTAVQAPQQGSQDSICLAWLTKWSNLVTRDLGAKRVGWTAIVKTAAADSPELVATAVALQRFLAGRQHKREWDGQQHNN